MVRKRQSASTFVRYEGKMYRVGTAVVGPEYAREYANVLFGNRQAGFGIYHYVHELIRANMGNLEIPSAQLGLYMAFANEFISKVMIRKIATEEEVKTKWERYGLEARKLDAIVDLIRGHITMRTGQPTPKPSST